MFYIHSKYAPSKPQDTQMEISCLKVCSLKQMHPLLLNTFMFSQHEVCILTFWIKRDTLSDRHTHTWKTWHNITIWHFDGNVGNSAVIYAWPRYAIRRWVEWTIKHTQMDQNILEDNRANGSWLGLWSISSFCGLLFLYGVGVTQKLILNHFDVLQVANGNKADSIFHRFT